MLTREQVYGGAMPEGATHGLSLTLVYFNNGRWSRRAILRAVRGAAEILDQCHVFVRSSTVVRVDAPQRYHFFDTSTSRELARALRLTKPTVYFVADTRARPAFDAEAIGRANSSTRPELADTVWFTRSSRDPAIALAHELVHVLSDSGAHTDLADNVMNADTAPGNTRLTDSQCRELRGVGTRHGLLSAP